MSLPLFYKEDLLPESQTVFLDEPTSKHVIQVLRMEVGESLQLTDGKGNLLTANITDDNRKKCVVKISEAEHIENPVSNVVIAISPVKNNSRFEWFLEKATEIGVSAIVPLMCERTEKQHFKFDRMKGILVSAMLQSQQVWLPVLQPPVKYVPYVESQKDKSDLEKYIAHCESESNKIQLSSVKSDGKKCKLILIGAEGDFTKSEIELAITNHFIPVALGNTRLRTETAGIVSAALLVNQQCGLVNL
jgi:16S rRNA (uracil1498-N3)-methyltransferase